MEGSDLERPTRPKWMIPSTNHLDYCTCTVLGVRCLRRGSRVAPSERILVWDVFVG